MNHKYVYLVFTRTGTWLSKLICTFSRMKYAHTSISFDNSFTKMYSFGRTNPNNPFSGGFVEENIYEGVYKKFPNCKCMIYRIQITEEQYNILQQQVGNFISEKEKYGYNFIGLFGVLLRRPIKRQYRYFCSQFVSEILINSNIYYGKNIPELTRTNELLSIENKMLIYEGLVNEVRRLSYLKTMSDNIYNYNEAMDIPHLL